MSNSLIRLPQVSARTGLKKSAIYKWMRQGRFPRPVPINEAGTAVGWLSHEIDQWVAERVAAARKLSR